MAKPRAILWTAVSTQAQAEDEKASLPAQEADLRALADKQGWDVIDVLRVPGHSRRYIDWHELVRDSLKAGIDSFARLQQHWERRDFDVLAVRDADRFARTQTLHAYVVERTIDAGALIWSLSDGKVDEQNFRMFIAMSGYKAAGAIDQLQKYRAMAIEAKPAQGLPVAGRPLWSHKIIRNDLGRAIAYVVDESKRRAFDDLAELIVAGVAWYDIAVEMTARGHRTDRGNPMYQAFVYGRVLHPIWWGHAALHLNTNYGAQRFGPWVFDPDEPAPEGVKLWRDAYPAVWTGDCAEAVKAELRRRHNVVKGRASANHTRRFSGLVVCGECGHTMFSTSAKRWFGLDCTFRYREPRCLTGKSISEKKVVAFLTSLLVELKKSGNPESIFGGGSAEAEQNALKSAQAELASIHAQARNMARLYASSNGSALEHVYASELANLEKQASDIERVIARSQAVVTNEPPRRAALDELDVENFWNQPDRVINQTLHVIFGQWRLVVKDKEIVGYTKSNRRATRRKPE